MSDSNVQLLNDTISSWAESPLRHVTRLCLSFLQGLFAQSTKGNWKWSQDPEETDIIITDEQPISVDVVNKRPCIVTVRSPVAWAGIALDQLQDYNFRTGERKHTDLISGHMTFNCMARKKDPAETLSWIVARHLWILRRVFLTSGFHDFGQRIQIMSASPPGSIINGAAEPETVNIPVIVPFYFQWEDTIRAEDLEVVQQIEARISLEFPRTIRPTPMAEGGSPGPGLRGSAVGARVSGVRGLRPPWIRGRTLNIVSTDTLPDSQQPGNPLEQDILT
jgi:hypothetical protein